MLSSGNNISASAIVVRLKMKVILTGSTGFIGGEVLKHCLANVDIDSLVILSRRQLPQLQGIPKAKVVLMQDFLQYPTEVLEDIDGSDACIWYRVPKLSKSRLRTNKLQVIGYF